MSFNVNDWPNFSDEKKKKELTKYRDKNRKRYNKSRTNMAAPSVIVSDQKTTIRKAVHKIETNIFKTPKNGESITLENINGNQ